MLTQNPDRTLLTWAQRKINILRPAPPRDILRGNLLDFESSFWYLPRMSFCVLRNCCEQLNACRPPEGRQENGRNESVSRIIITTALLIITLIFPIGRSPGETEDASAKRAREILRQVDDMWRGTSSHSILTMQVRTAHYTRDMRMEGWSKGRDETLVRILSPLKEKGTATLKSGSDIYSYLPKTDRTIKLTSGMMMGSWMGSHFTNDDLVRESRMEEDYEPSISYEGERDGRKVIEFTLMPKPDAAVVWGKIVATVLADGYMPVKYYYYDEDMKISRTMTFDRFEMLAGKIRPRVMRVVPSDKPEEYTELVYEELELNISLKDEFFSISSLKRM